MGFLKSRNLQILGYQKPFPFLGRLQQAFVCLRIPRWLDLLIKLVLRLPSGDHSQTARAAPLIVNYHFRADMESQIISIFTSVQRAVAGTQFSDTPNQYSHLQTHKQTKACWSIPRSQMVFIHFKVCIRYAESWNFEAFVVVQCPMLGRTATGTDIEWLVVHSIKNEIYLIFVTIFNTLNQIDSCAN